MFFSLQVPESTVNFIYVLNIEIVIFFLKFQGLSFKPAKSACLVCVSPWLQLWALSTCLLLILQLIEHLEMRN